MTIKKGCRCFGCRHRDNQKLLTAYYKGYIEASEWFLNWCKANDIKIGSIADNDLSGLYAQIKCNYEETLCILSELPDIE